MEKGFNPAELAKQEEEKKKKEEQRQENNKNEERENEENNEKGLEGLDSKIEKMPGELNIRESNEAEKKRLKERIPQSQMEALKKSAKVFNEICEYPWYVTGSIAFLINAEDSNKQPDDVDIIFHEEDFKKISEYYQKEGFESKVAEETNCPFITGFMEVENKGEKGKEKTVEMEAFAQSTENPNGLINPGTKKTKYNIIKNSLSENEKEDFYILDKEAQIELYTKNLIKEIGDYNLDSTLKNLEKEGEEFYQKDKSKKFAFRLANLFELNNNNPKEIISKYREIAGNDDKGINNLKILLQIGKEFNKIPEENQTEEPEKNQEEKKGLTNILNEGHLQESVAKLQEKIESQRKDIVNIYSEIQKKYKDIKSLSKAEKIKFKEEIATKIAEKEEMISEFLNYNEEINKKEYYKDLPIYTFTTIFKNNYIEPFCKKMEEISNQLDK